jgi:type VI secretion system protein ImpG
MGLKTILRDALGMNNIRIIQNIRRMVPIPDDQRMRMLVSGRRLGMDTVLGSKIADRTGRFRIRIGPLTWREFNDLLPGTARNDKLTSLTRFYLTDPLEVELELVLAAGEAQPIRIGDPEARLGLNTWDFAGKSIGEVSARFRLETLPTRKRHPSEPDTPPPKTAHTFVDYYCRERQLLGEYVLHFVESHPNLAPMVNGPMADQGVEKLLEKTSFYNALLQEKLNDDIPELIHEVTRMLYPEQLRPVPASTIIAFTPKEGLTQTQVIPAGAEVVSIPVQGTGCRFRTCYDVTVHPLTLLDASYSHPSGKAPRITLQFELNGLGLSTWKATSLRIYLADDYPAACDLWLLLLRYLKRIRITSHDNGSTIEIPSDCLKPAGFAEEETVLTKEKSFMPGHLILQEYFLFRDKFLFPDLTGLERCGTLGDSSRFELTLELDACPLIVPRITHKSFVLSATPVINLFKHKAKPISFVSELTRHVVRPAGKPPAHFRIYSVDQVRGLVKGRKAGILYDLQNPLLKSAEDGHACHITQSPSAIGDGFDTVLSIEDENRTGRITLDIELTCNNGTLPEQLAIGDICTVTGATPESVEPANIKAVTGAAFPKFQQNRQWRLLSGFSLNSLSLNSVENFRALLRLFIHPDSRNQAAVVSNRKKIDAIESIDAQQADRLIGRRMYRGYDIRLKLRGDGFAGPGDLYLFSSVLERFLGGYVTQYCFLRLVVEEIEKGYRFEWPARMGDRRLA